MLYANDAGIVSKSVEGLAKMMTVVVTALEAAGPVSYTHLTLPTICSV